MLINLFSTPTIIPKSSMKKWTDDIIEEMKTFLGILMWIDLSFRPNLVLHQSKNKLYISKILNYTTRNRFEIVLRTFRGSNNAVCPSSDGLYKVRGLVDLLVKKFLVWNMPAENTRIDESVAPFIRKLTFPRYIKKTPTPVRYQSV